MPIVGLDSIRNRSEDSDDEGKNNRYYSGGVNSQGGGSGLAVISGSGDKYSYSVFFTSSKVSGKDFCKKDENEEHKRFYDDLLNGYVPQPYEREVRLSGLNIIVDDHRDEDYRIPPPRFGYVGNKLGTSPSNEADTAPATTPGTALNKLPLDDGKATFPVRVRLSTGRAITLNITDDWDCDDLYSAISEFTPGMNFELIGGGFPPKQIMRGSNKLKSLGIDGMVIRQVQHLCVCLG